jgi:guanine deaminase
MRMLAGKVLMDRNAPEALCDTVQSGYDDSKAALLRWHDRGRLLYCVTPRFAATSSPAQLDAASALWREHPGTYLQSHIAENRNEIAWVKELFPDRLGYLDVYDHHGALGPRAIYGHGIWLDESGSLAATRPARRSRTVRHRTHSSAAACSNCTRRASLGAASAWRSRRTSAPGRVFRCSPPCTRPTRSPSSTDRR